MSHLSHDPTQTAVARVIEWSVRNPLLVSVLGLLILVGGIFAINRTPLDAIPDLSDTQVIVRTDFAGQAPQIIENLVTYPLSSAMLGLPKTKVVRGFSMFGASFVYVIFKDGTDPYWARSRVLEALSKVQSSLPPGARTQIGPDATGVGWVYQYALVDKSGKHDLAQLRALQDWFLKFELATVSGVSEVASVGGFVKEYQVLVDPQKLRKYGIALERVEEVVKASSQETGGRVIEQAETEFVIRSKGYVTGVADLEKLALKARNGEPIRLAQIARIIEGPELRRGNILIHINGFDGLEACAKSRHRLAVPFEFAVRQEPHRQVGDAPECGPGQLLPHIVLPGIGRDQEELHARVVGHAQRQVEHSHDARVDTCGVLDFERGHHSSFNRAVASGSL
ncbi:MAG: efflux RND transporter permease subunit, partial [Alphaproteobacteria bacterium]|nr:efflux RND transporter permease subunit [Alphaproteobacteria bacterium]